MTCGLLVLQVHSRQQKPLPVTQALVPIVKFVASMGIREFLAERVLFVKGKFQCSQPEGSIYSSILSARPKLCLQLS